MRIVSAGQGKSIAARLLRELIDPHKAPLRAEPHVARDLMIAAHNTWCLMFDNLSHIPTWFSDALCRLSTGGGFTTRELYTNSEEMIFDSQRPVLLNSVEEVAKRSDLLDRCLIISLSAIPDSRRRAESEMVKAFDSAKPMILGALLDAVATALRELPHLELPDLPRLADFAQWVSAAETAWGWHKGNFLSAYQGNRRSAHELALECSPIAKPMLELLADHGEWSSTASELLATLCHRFSDNISKQTGWPKNARSFTGQLKRLSPNLRAYGWQITFERQANQRLVVVHRLPDFASPQPHRSSQPVPHLMQRNAKSCRLFSNDDADAKSAQPNAQDTSQPLTWEEGVL